MTTISIELSDVEMKTFEFVADDPQFWAENLVRSRIKMGADEITQTVVKHCLDNGLEIPASRDEIIMFGFDQNIVKTVQEHNQWVLDNSPTIESPEPE
jgi:hypothetical protein